MTFLRLYRGIPAPLLAEACRKAYKFPTYLFFREKIFDRTGSRHLYLKTTLAGTLTGSFEAILIAPFEVAKIRMMSPLYLGKYPNSWNCFTQIVSQEGFRGLSLGLGAAICRNSVWSGCYFGFIRILDDNLPLSDVSSVSYARTKTAFVHWIWRSREAVRKGVGQEWNR